MRAMLLVVTAAAALAAGAGFAQSGPDVLKAKGCMNCHENDKKKVGPAFKDVAAKYKGDKGAAGGWSPSSRTARAIPRLMPPTPS